MTADCIEKITFVESVARRPKMWTTNGTLEEIIALFNGYEIAIRHSGHKPKERPTPSDALRWFSKEAFQDGETVSNDQLVDRLRSKYENDNNALNDLVNWLEKIRLSDGV